MPVYIESLKHAELEAEKPSHMKRILPIISLVLIWPMLAGAATFGGATIGQATIGGTTAAAAANYGAVGVATYVGTNLAGGPMSQLTISCGSSGLNRVLIVGVMLYSATGVVTNNPTYGGNATQVICSTNFYSPLATGGTNIVYYLANPPAGNNNLVFSYSAPTRFVCWALFLTNANQSASIGSFTEVYLPFTGTFYGQTNSVPSSLNDEVVDFYTCSSKPTFWVPSPQIALTNLGIWAFSMGMVSSYAPASAGSTTMAWTNTPAATAITHIIVDVQARQ